MAVVATLTIGATTYSVYGQTSGAIADADKYFGARLGATAWTAATTLLKQQALITAVRFLDRGVLWSGAKTVSSQALEWPRDGADCRGVSVTDNTIPDNIALGEFELALALLESEDVQDAVTGGGRSLKSVRTGSVNLEFFGAGTASGPDVFRRFPVIVHELVDCYADGGPASAGPVASGVNDPEVDDQQSSFGSVDDSFNLSQGLP